MRVRLKIQHDPSWRPNLRFSERYWIKLSTGEYFPIFSGHSGQWYNLFAQHMDYPSAEAAIADALDRLFNSRASGVDYTRLRVKEQAFTFSDKKFSRLTLPHKRKKLETQTVGG